MSETLLSEHIEETLCELSWETRSGIDDQWKMLFQLIVALSAQRRVLGAVTGSLRLSQGSIDAPTFEEWPIGADADTSTLRARLDALDDRPWPVELRFDCEPLLWLVDDHVRLVDYDDVISDGPNLWSPGCATITEVADGTDRSSSLRLWRLRHAPVPLLTLEAGFGTPSFATAMSLRFKSSCDLWRSKRLDGEPNIPHGQANADMLAQCAKEIAAATGAQLEVYS